MSLKNVKNEANIVEEVKLLEELKHPNLANKLLETRVIYKKTRLQIFFSFSFSRR